MIRIISNKKVSITLKITNKSLKLVNNTNNLKIFKSKVKDIISLSRFLKFVTEIKEYKIKEYTFNYDELVWIINNCVFVKKYLSDRYIKDLHCFDFLIKNDFCLLYVKLKELQKRILNLYLKVYHVFDSNSLEYNFIVYMKLKMNIYNQDNIKYHIGDGYFRILIISMFFDNIDIFKIIFPKVLYLDKMRKIFNIKIFPNIIRLFNCEKIAEYINNETRYFLPEKHLDRYDNNLIYQIN